MNRSLSSGSPKDRFRRRTWDRRPELEALEERIQLSLVAVPPSSDTKVNSTVTLDQTVPSVAMDANGDFVVVWNDQTHLAPQYMYNVEARVYNAAGQPQADQFAVAQTTGYTHPSVAMDANGDFVVAWQVLNASSYLYGIDAQRYNFAGTAQGSMIVVNTGGTSGTSGESPKVAMDSTGDFVIAYQGYDSNSHGIFAQRFNSSGTSQGSIFGVNTTTSGNQSGPAIAMDSGGDFVIAWQDGGTADNPGVYAQLYKPSGATNGSNTAISTIAPSTTVSSPGNPSVAMQPTGQFVVAWQFDQTASGTGHGAQQVAAQSFAPAVAPATGFVPVLTSPVQLNTSENYDQGSPAVAVDSAGDFVVAWNSYGQGGTASSVNTLLAQRVNAAGSKIGTTQFLPSTQTGDNQRSPSVANDPNGDAAIVWESKPSATSPDQDVFLRQYNRVNDAPTITTPIGNVTINENAGQQTVNLSGITTGGGETQTLAVMATSNNTALVADPSVTYTSPGSTGSLTFTPAANGFGTATILVTVVDNGGTLHGGTNTTTASFTVTVNHVAATVSAVSVSWGTSGTAALTTAGDGLRLLPSGRNTDMPWLGINKLTITLSAPATLSSSDVSVTGISVANYGPVMISGSGTSYTITLAQAITVADRVTVTIGNAGITTFTRRLDVLPGDVNDDGIVTMADALQIRNEFLGLTPVTVALVFLDINGDGVVDVNDYNAARSRIGAQLPSNS